MTGHDKKEKKMDIKTIISLDKENYLNTFGDRTPVAFTSGKGARLTDTEGKVYLDFLAGIAVNILGHGNDHLVDAICKQAKDLIHCSNLYYIEQQADLASRLTKMADMDRAFFCNSGAEANEGAIKLVRGYYHKINNRRRKIYSAKNSFHGRTLATVTATGQPKYSAPFAPLPQGFEHIPFNDLDALKEAVSDPFAAAIMLELVQGEGGVHPVDLEYAKAADDLCKSHGVKLIVDEIQTGMGRTGHFTASQAYGIKPDVITMAKGLGGGVPIGALLARGAVTTGFVPGDHGTTFGGNPLACAAAIATLDEYKRLKLDKASAETGSYLLTALQKLARKNKEIAEVRGVGLMLGIDLKVLPAPAVRDALFRLGVLVNATGASTLRLLPPLIITKEDCDEFIDRFTQALDQVANQKEG